MYLYDQQISNASFNAKCPVCVFLNDISFFVNSTTHVKSTGKAEKKHH